MEAAVKSILEAGVKNGAAPNIQVRLCQVASTTSSVTVDHAFIPLMLSSNPFLQAAVAKDGKIILNLAAGTTNADGTGSVVKPDTPVRIMSMTKVCLPLCDSVSS